VTISATMNPETYADIQRVTEVIADRAPLFAGRWRDALASREATPLTVLEFACGSANDYRALADYGIARFLDYTGVDLNETNIANARRFFPDVNFRVGSVLSLPEADRSVDYVIGFDIMEHLSLPAMQQAMDSAARICRRGLYFAFFRMDEVAEHVNNPRGNYHFNLLSAPQVREDMAGKFASVQLIRMPEMLSETLGYAHSYNPRAYSLITEGPL
jgi:ubiquinone/menaquinone biosynthesis C-methylase UbiE